MSLVAGPDLVFCHVPKCAGTWTSTVLRELSLADWDTVVRCNPRAASHSSLRDVLPLLDGRLVFANVRDPWSWYVSLWLHFTAQGPPFNGCIEQFWPRALSWDDVNEPARFRAWLAHATLHPWALAEPDGGIEWPGPGRISGAVAEMQREGCGYYSWMLGHMLLGEDGSPLVDAVVSTDRAGQGLARLLGPRLEGWPGMDKANVSTRWSGALSEWYDDESRRWVSRAERDWIDRCGFRSGELSGRPVTWFRSPADNCG